MFDSADVYSKGWPRVLGAAIKGRRNKVIISTKQPSASATGPMTWVSRAHLTEPSTSLLKRSARLSTCSSPRL
jgi:aryl-alcohol dehydrogenase-like predicted oxidoreductase